jgi:hypothetical protein
LAGPLAAGRVTVTHSENLYNGEYSWPQACTLQKKKRDGGLGPVHYSEKKEPLPATGSRAPDSTMLMTSIHSSDSYGKYALSCSYFVALVAGLEICNTNLQ